MKTIVYTDEFLRKIEILKLRLVSEFGERTEKKKMKEIYNVINLLSLNEYLGLSVREIFGIDCDFYYIYAVHNYVFYSISEKMIKVLNIFDEREDFMMKMFGIKS